MLVEQTLFGKVDKVQMAIDRIKTFEPPEGYYGATSFGKDSIVLMRLVEEGNIKVDWHNNITGIDPPELVYFGRKYYPDVQRNFPREKIWSLIRRKHMPPTRGKRFCCEFLKESNGGGRTVLLGVRWAESQKRSKRRMTEKCYRDKSKTYINPIIDWSDADIWEFIKSRNMPYCSLYDEGFKRLGCVGCPSSNIKREFERWPGIAKLWKKAIYDAWRECKDGKKGFSSPDEMWNWYVEGKHYGEDPDQTVMFE